MLLLLAAAVTSANDLPSQPATTPVSVADTLPAGGGPEWRDRMLAWSAPAPSVESSRIVPALERPVASGYLTSTFGVRTDPFAGTWRAHRGIDIAAPLGTPVVASADGIVSFAGRAGGYGRLVQIDRSDGLRIRYGHLSTIATRPGARVRRGEVIGAMGSTGRSTGSHLHFEISMDGVAVDPLSPLPTPRSDLWSSPVSNTSPPLALPPAGPVASDQRLPAAYR